MARRSLRKQRTSKSRRSARRSAKSSKSASRKGTKTKKLSGGKRKKHTGRSKKVSNRKRRNSRRKHSKRKHKMSGGGGGISPFVRATGTREPNPETKEFPITDSITLKPMEDVTVLEGKDKNVYMKLLTNYKDDETLWMLKIAEVNFPLEIRSKDTDLFADYIHYDNTTHDIFQMSNNELRFTFIKKEELNNRGQMKVPPKSQFVLDFADVRDAATFKQILIQYQHKEPKSE
tara:strand:- start:571 stop:1266 length:696 start_codon:yes stop_codon:yes gene_type:complete